MMRRSLRRVSIVALVALALLVEPLPAPTAQPAAKSTSSAKAERSAFATVGDVLVDAVETKHADQWSIFGPPFWLMYYGVEVRTGGGRRNWFERWAGLEDGGY